MSDQNELAAVIPVVFTNTVHRAGSYTKNGIEIRVMDELVVMMEVLLVMGKGTKRMKGEGKAE